MPHLIIEYPPAVSREAAVGMCGEMAAALGSLRRDDGSHEYPPSGTFVRAYPAEVAHLPKGQTASTFVHATLKIGPGRSPATKEATGAALLKCLQDFFARPGNGPLPAISIELTEFPATLWRA